MAANTHQQRPLWPQTVPQALGRLRVALDDAYLRASRQHGLTAQQAELLCAALQPTPVGSLARTLRCDQSNVTRLVDRASKRGLIRRRNDRDDGRVTLIELSAKGRKAAEAFIATLEDQLATLLATWPEERQSETVATLNEISTALDERRRPPRDEGHRRDSSRRRRSSYAG
jgi:DNA-binding MarR family transcriptional regulator